MSNWAIVAIPEEDDYVWKISSEKVPHLTLLHLGDQTADEETLSLMEKRIASYLEHVASSAMHNFGLSVDRRGPLGPQNADVLFFEKEFGVPELEAARGFLLIDHDIADAYNSTDQYRGWTPHLTLGFPESPAKPDERDYPGIHWVNFNRIALWTGDYSGPEYRLQSRHDSLSMSQQSEEFLAHLEERDLELFHFGVKGMKWGVRRDSEGLGVHPKTAAAAKKDAEEFTRAKLFYGKGAGTRRKLIKARVDQKSSSDPDYKKAFDHYVNKTDLSKRADQAKGERRRKDVSASTAKTARGIKNVVVGNPQAASIAALGIVAGAKALKDSGYPQKAAAAIAKLAQDRRNHKIVDDLLNSMKHEDGAGGEELFHFLANSEGFRTHLEANGLEMVVLEHSGVKGMKWGVRKAETSGGESSSTASGKSGSANSSAAPEKHSQWKKRVAGAENANKVFQEAAKTFDPIFKTINNDPSYKGKDLDAPENRSLRSAYDTSVATAFNQHLAQVSINMTVGNTTKGVRAYVFQFDRDRGMMRATEHKQVEHADFSKAPVFKVELDELGQVKSIKFVEAESVQLDHSITENEGFLAYLEANDLEIVHFGVKGMKWGVRKREGGSSKPRGAVRRGATKARTALNAGRGEIDKGEEKLIFLPKQQRSEAANATQLRVLGVAKTLNKDPKYHGKDLKRDQSLRDDYHNEIARRAADIYKEELGAARGRAVAQAIDALVSPRMDSIGLRSSRVRHAEGDDGDVLLTLRFTKDDLGQIIGIEVEDPLEHDDLVDGVALSHIFASEDNFAEFLDSRGLELCHYGVRGMKWGVRRKRGPSGRVNADPDHTDVAALRSKISNAGGTHVVSNAELRKINDRLNLETSYARLTAEKSSLSSTQDKVKAILNMGQTVNSAIQFYDSNAGRLLTGRPMKKSKKK